MARRVIKGGRVGPQHRVTSRWVPKDGRGSGGKVQKNLGDRSYEGKKWKEYTAAKREMWGQEIREKMRKMDPKTASELLKDANRRGDFIKRNKIHPDAINLLLIALREKAGKN